jgi:RNA polymerase sigma-70 factor (sigma-E family)
MRGTSWNRCQSWGVDDVVSQVGRTVQPAAQTFEDFFVESWPWAFRLASLLTRSTEAGEDIGQDALVAMSQRWGEADRPAAYLRTSLVNRCANWHRRNRTVRAKLPLLARRAESIAEVDEMTDAIARLPFRQRAVVVLRYYSDLSEAEIADILGCRPGTVKSLASRALNTLSKEIEP